MNAISRLVIDTDCCCVFLYGTCKIINQVSQCRHRYVSWSLSTSPSPARIFYSYFIDFFAFVRVFSAICCCCSYLTLVCFLPTREKRSKKKKRNWHRMEANFYCVYLKQTLETQCNAFKFVPLCRLHAFHTNVFSKWKLQEPSQKLAHRIASLI